MYTYRRPVFGSQQRVNGSTSSSATSSRPPLPKLPLWDAHQFRALNKATPEFYRRQTTQIDDTPINHSNHQPQIQQQQRYPVDGTLPRQTSRHIVQGSPSGLLLPRLRPPPNQLPRSIPPRSPPPYRPPPPRNSPRLQQARQPRLESAAPKRPTPHREKSPSKQATNAIESTPVYAQPRPRMDTATLPRNFHVMQKIHDMPVDEGFSSNSMNSSQSSNDYMPSKAEPQVKTMTRGGMLQQKSFDETGIRVHPDYNVASMGRRNKVPVGAMFDDRRFSTMEATQRLYKKHNVSTNQLHDGYSTMPTDVARPRAPSAQSGMSPALHGVNTLPSIGISLVEPPKKQRTDQIFDALVNGFRSYIAFYSGERDRLRAELEATNDAATVTRIEHELVLVEENVQLFESHLHRVSRLQDRYRQGHFASLKAKSSSLSDLRAALSGKSASSSSTIAAPSAAIHNELAAMMGRLSIELKTVAGFARVAPGDVFEVQIRHGNTKWKARGKTQADRTQRWDREATTFECHPSSTVDVKVCEVRLFKTKPLAERSFDPCELFAASPQMVTISLNTLGTMKLQMIVTWIPLLASKSGIAPTITRTPTSMLSEQAEEAKKPRVVLREKKRGGAARAATKEQWRSSTNLLDSIYHDLSKNIPTVEAMSTQSHRLSMLAVSSSSPDVSSGTPLIPSTSNLTQTVLLSAPQDSPESMRGRACTGGSQGVSSCSSATSSSDVVSLSSVCSALLDLLDECLPIASSLSKERHRELHTTHQILVHWSRILRHPNASGGASFLRRSAFVRGDEIDDNVLLADHGSENDSGIDSLRQQISPYARRVPGESVGHSTASRFSQMRDRRKSLGAMLDPSELERMCLESDRFWQDEHATAKHETATGHHEVDACLAHHLTRIRNSLKVLTGISGPLLYLSTEHLRRIEADTVALDDLIRLTPSLPILPNITNVLCELGAEGIVQEAWLSACYPLHASLVVPFEELRTQLRANVSPIVEPTYPHLVTRVTESLCRLLLDGSPASSPPSSPIQMTVFHFVSLFRGRHFAAFVESLAHDAWMISLLSTRQPRNVNIVFERLTQVPMAPPIDTLRHVALLLQNGDPHLNTNIERYLSGSVGRLHSDLLSSFLCLLEADDVYIRIGAIRALGMLKSARIAAQVWWVAERDRSQDVRHEAMCLLEDFGEVEGDKDGHEQVTRI